ncbi:hypothetical protein [Flavobacterium sp.]|uniref:hypothetical protein n=1 Tax=Flavobacterium sp. TaxID=239 RepID=UPI002601E1FB|nr:hypothetical protein [Flavobacterium sp.]
MENFFIPDENEVIENFRKTNPTKEDYYDIISESDPEFLSKDYNSQISNWDDVTNIQTDVALDHDGCKDFEEDIDRYSLKVPDGYIEIELYDNHKSVDENFENGSSKKYILIEVDKNTSFSVANVASVIPTPQSRCLIDIEKVEDYGSLEFIPIDYDTIFGLRLLSFEKYKSDFFQCDERVMFEAFLIKYQRFGFKPFYWSKEVIFEEVGIKKDRATKIIEKFINLGIASKKCVSSFINNRPMQINYFDLNPDKIIELLPLIYLERESISMETEIKKYLIPALKKK